MLPFDLPIKKTDIKRLKIDEKILRENN